MTVDLEQDLRSTECKSMEKVVPKLLELFDKYNITATFFVVSSLLDKYSDQIKEIAKKHEIASHSHSHSGLTEENASFEISESKKKFKEYGIEIKGFRAPMFITTKNHFTLLKENGYLYDSSLARYFPGRYINFGMKSKPFIYEGIQEFPMPNFVWPSINSGLSYLKLFHPISKLFGKPYMFYLHPWEFLEKDELNSNSFIGKLLQRNSGFKAWRIFEDYLKRCKGEWVSCEEWIKLNPQPFP